MAARIITHLEKELDSAAMSLDDLSLDSALLQPWFLQLLVLIIQDHYDTLKAHLEKVSEGSTIWKEQSKHLLHIAARQGSYWGIRALCEVGCDADLRVHFRPKGVPPVRGLMPKGRYSWRAVPDEYADLEFPRVEAGILSDMGTTPLEEAILSCQFGSVESLLNHKADPHGLVLERLVRDLADHPKGESAKRDIGYDHLMNAAIERNSIYALKTTFRVDLMTIPPGYFQSSVGHLILRDNIPSEMFDFLLPIFAARHGLDEGYESAMWMEGHRHEHINQMLRLDKPSETSFLEIMTKAVEHTCTDTMGLLLELWPGMDINMQRPRYLSHIFQAARTTVTNSEALQFLLSRGANPGLVAESEDEHVPMDRHRSHSLSNGVDRAEYCYIAKGDTPLHIVAKAPGLSVDLRRQRMQMLIEAGADPNAQNAVGHTPLHSDMLRTVYVHDDWQDDYYNGDKNEAKIEVIKLFKTLETAREQKDTVQITVLCAQLSVLLSNRFHKESMVPYLESVGADRTVKDIRGRDCDQFLSKRWADTLLHGRSMPAALLEMDLPDATLEEADAIHLMIHLEGPGCGGHDSIGLRRYNGRRGAVAEFPTRPGFQEGYEEGQDFWHGDENYGDDEYSSEGEGFAGVDGGELSWEGDEWGGEGHIEVDGGELSSEGEGRAEVDEEIMTRVLDELVSLAQAHN